eukprot:TRINITY_DN9265_c5_g1_i1.p1 TRINITY_DN9265_c5_g1~~TRINITY_DN9265_c5_g1_i1.p1  ORF type:complete len:327 (+),score=97.94 TRINITY_DN9265_c5_g1_i1:50-1030(+)
MSEEATDIIEVAYVDDTPSLWWVLLTRLDGLSLVLITSFIIFLLLRALFVVQKKLEDANGEIRRLSAGGTPAPTPPPPPSAAAKPSPTAATDGQQECYIRDLQRVITEKDAQLRDSTEQLNKLYTILADTSEDLTRVPDMQTKLRDELVLNQQLRAELEVKDAMIIELQAGLGDRQELELAAADLQDKLTAAEDKIRQNTSVWELMLTQQIASNNSAVGPAAGVVGAAPSLRRSSTPRVRPTTVPSSVLGEQPISHNPHISPSIDRIRLPTPTRRHHTPNVDTSTVASRTTPLRSRTAASSQAGKTQEEYLSYLENQIRLLENQGY